MRARYAASLPDWAAELPARDLVQAIALASGAGENDLRFGATRLFCRAARGGFLERLLGGDEALGDSASLPEVVLS